MVTKDTTVIQARVVLRCVPGIIEELDKILARSDTFSSRNQLIMAILDDFIHNNQILDEKTVLVGFPMRPLFRQKIEPAEKAIEKENGSDIS
jgi:hypothetical protein